MFYVRMSGQIRGPFDLNQLRSLRERGRLQPFLEISTDRVHWVEASSRPDLFPATQPANAMPVPGGAASPTGEAWYFANAQGGKEGPVSREQLQAMMDAGTVTTNTLVWRAGMPSWAAAGSPEAGVSLPMGYGYSMQYGQRKKSRGPLLFIGGAVGTLLLGGLIVFGIWFFAIRGKAVSDWRDEKTITSSVGLVVRGVDDQTSDELPLEIPANTGSCFAITADGYLITNKHVIEMGLKNIEAYRARNPNKIHTGTWVFFGEEKHKAKVIHVSDNFDMAILKIERSGGPFFKLSTSEDISRGSKVMAYGFPALAGVEIGDQEKMTKMVKDKTVYRNVRNYFKDRDFQYTLTDGTVSRVFAEDGSHRKWVQHNAPISGGNSGGPLLTENGIVVGINTIGVKAEAAQGIFMALSMQQLRKEIEKHVPGVQWD
jgi:hypothetical protein